MAIVDRLQPLLSYDINCLENRDPVWFARFFTALEPVLRLYFKPVVRGVGRVPSGGGVYVGNHSGGLMTVDTFVLASALWRRYGVDELPLPLTHETVMKLPGFNQLLAPLGCVCANAENAHRILASGHKVLVYPGGDLDTHRPYRDRNAIHFGPRRGYLRLILREDVPLIPVISAGSHAMFRVLTDGQHLAHWLALDKLLRLKVCPISLCLPYGVMVGTWPYIPAPTRIFIQIMEPIEFPRYGTAAAQDDAYVEECHIRVHAAMEAQLRRLAAERDAAGWRDLPAEVTPAHPDIPTHLPEDEADQPALELA